MRGGTYGWQAADAGLIGICWTNTMPNLPPWGAEVPRIGNNPLVVAVPRPDGHVVLEVTTRKAANREAREADLAEALAFARLNLAVAPEGTS